MTTKDLEVCYNIKNTIDELQRVIDFFNVSGSITLNSGNGERRFRLAHYDHKPEEYRFCAGNNIFDTLVPLIKNAINFEIERGIDNLDHYGIKYDKKEIKE